MAFNSDDFSENIDYCEYVYRKSFEYGLLLTDEDIQRLANMYAFELDSLGEFDDDEVIENDELLLDVYDKLLIEYNNPKTEYIDYDKEEELRELKLKQERLINSMGGYAFDESFDDHCSDEIASEYTLKYKREE